MSAHSTFSASAASRWLACPGSIALSVGKPDNTSKYAAEGTVAHGLLEEYLTRGTAPEGSLGAFVLQDGFSIEVSQDMVDAVRTAIGHIDEMTKLADLREAEKRVNYSRWLGVPEAEGFGTLDLAAVFIDSNELLIGDYKHGMGVVVDAENNEQMMLYAGGKLLELDDLGIDIDTIRMVIFQPRARSAPSEWSIPRAELEAWLTGRARSGAASVMFATREFDDPKGAPAEWQSTFLKAGEKQCRFCKAKADCPQLRAEVADYVSSTIPATPEDFRDMSVNAPMAVEPDAPEWLAMCLEKVDMIEDWCSAVRAEAHRRLTAGEPVPGFKLVQGKRGNRAWSDASATEALLKETYRLKIDEMYDLKLISPTVIEKRTKPWTDADGVLRDPVVGPRQWLKLKDHIAQKEGAPSVAPITDPRPALDIAPVADSFTDLTATPLV